MSRLRVHKNKSNFMLEGKPFFYLGDTIWSAFTNVTLEEWEYYLSVRKAQGFTVLQINTLPQWDRCMSDVGLYPFSTADGHTFDFASFNEEYYRRARKMCRMATEQGFQLALVVLWLNYVPGTWGSRMLDTNIMPEEMLECYADKIVEQFDEFDPIYVVSGDTDFDTDEAVRYYGKVLNRLCEKSPDSLKTMHIKRGYDFIPAEFLDKIDFYMFQSGHNAQEQKMAYVLPERFREKYPPKPMINAEPCYEQMGFSRQEYGRFERDDIRKAAWDSILSGACAGVTYGAHGIWNWQKLNKPKNPVLGEGFDEPVPWQEAVKFAGAWDYGFIRYILEEHHATELIPANKYLKNQSEEIRMAASGENYYVYLPHNTKVVISRNLAGYTVKAMDLDKRYAAYINMETTDEISTIAMHPFQKDVLLFIDKNRGGKQDE